MTAVQRDLDAFLEECDAAPSLLLAVDDEPTPRADVYNTFRALGIFNNSPPNLEGALAEFRDILAPEMTRIPCTEGIVLLPGYEEATEVSWGLMQNRITPTVKVFDIRIEKDAGKNPLNGVQARYDLADFDHAPVVYFTAFSSEYVGDKKLQAAAPVYLVEKGGAGTTERLRDVVTGLEHFGKIMRGLETMLLIREMVIEQLYEKRDRIEEKLGIKGKDGDERVTLERDFDRTAYGSEGISAIIDYSHPESSVFNLERMSLDGLSRYVETKVLPKLAKGENIGSYEPRDAYNMLVAKITAKETMIETMQNTLTDLRTNVVREGFGIEALTKLRALNSEVEAQENEYEMQFGDEWLGIAHVTTAEVKKRITAGTPEGLELGVTAYGSTTYDPTKARVFAMGVTRYVVGLDRTATALDTPRRITAVIDEDCGDITARVTMQLPDGTDDFAVTSRYQSDFALSMGEKILQSLDPKARAEVQYNQATKTIEVSCRVAGDKMI